MNQKLIKNKAIHFGVLLNTTKYLKINREDYAKIDNKNHSLTFYKRYHERMTLYKNSNDSFLQKCSKYYFDNYLNIFDDETLTTYKNEFCIEHQKKCLINYDLNMNFFNKIEYTDFEKIINKLKNRYKKLEEIKDLTHYEKKSGIYILVLDEYKQIYIGQTNDIKKRILQHWTRKKQFFQLIFGEIDKSILSIDSFGALDTTRIFVYETDDFYKQLDLEDKIVNYVPKDYILNRTKGGDRGLDNNEIVINTLATANNRKLTQ